MIFLIIKEKRNVPELGVNEQNCLLVMKNSLVVGVELRLNIHFDAFD